MVLKHKIRIRNPFSLGLSRVRERLHSKFKQPNIEYKLPYIIASKLKKIVSTRKLVNNLIINPTLKHLRMM